MAAGATVHTFEITLADVDRGIYEDFSLRVARHPSETAAFMVTRVLAYCLEHAEGIEFSEGIFTADEPAVLVRDLTGRITAWIEVGAPDAERLHRGSRAAERTAIYTHRDPDKLLASWDGKRIHERERISLVHFDEGLVEPAAALVERRNALTISVTDGHLYLELNGTALDSDVHSRTLA
ncbi:YaeQ family protein [Demequina sp.]|uniref:YaeQ family protein n=1 Tax=Demequina sp. TaxID=2050685 RepID=UPI003A8741BE